MVTVLANRDNPTVLSDLGRARPQGRRACRPPGLSAAKFELVLNLKTARSVGLDIAAKPLVLTDDVIE